MKRWLPILLSSGMVCLPALCHADSLGIAGAFNIVALGSGSTAGNISDNSDIGGRVAAAGQISVPVVGQSIINDQNGALANGNIIVAGNGTTSGDHTSLGANGNVFAFASDSSHFNFNGHSGSLTTTGSSPIDFSALRTTLDSESLSLGALAANGQVLVHGQPGFPSGANPSFLALVGTDPNLNVFNITAAQLADVNHPLDIVVPAGSTVIINVDGTSLTLGGAIYIDGVQVSETSDAGANILFNFDDATSVTLNGQLTASLLAPFATIAGNSSIDGTIIAAAFNDNGEVHNAEFTGNLPGPPAAAPEPGSLLLLGSGLAAITGLIARKKTLLAPQRAPYRS